MGAYIGMTPKQRQSGERDPQLRITKAGNAHLRQLLAEAAHYIMGAAGRPRARSVIGYHLVT